MPNWVRNHLTIEGDNAAEIMKSLLVKSDIDGEYDFDFNKIIPMPLDLYIEAGSSTYEATALYMTYINPLIDYYGENKMPVTDYINLCRNIQYRQLKEKPNYALSKEEVASYINRFEKTEKGEKGMLALGKQAVDNFLRFGATDWYEWSLSNWGTKWNAHNTEVPDINTPDIYFDTAWDRVPALIQKLSQMHKDCLFKYDYAEEQAGYFAGSITFKNGEVIERNECEPDSKECYEKYFELWGGEDEFKFNEKTGTYEYVDEDEME